MQFCRAETFGEQFDLRGFAGSLAASKEMNRPRPGVLLTAASAMVRVLGACAKHADHEFARAIDCRRIVDPCRPFRRKNRRLHGDVGALAIP